MSMKEHTLVLLSLSLFLLFAVQSSGAGASGGSAGACDVYGNYPMLQGNIQRTGGVEDISPLTNSLLWQSPPETAGCIESGVVAANGRVFFETWYSWMGGNATDALYCLDARTGEILWTNPNVYGASTPAIFGDKLFVGTLDGNLTCVNASSGEIIWSRRIEENPSWWGVASSPLILNDTVFVLSFSDGTLHAFSLDGTELWNFSTGGEIFVYASPSASSDGKIFLAGNFSGRNALICISQRGEEIWEFTTETPVVGTPTVWEDADLVFFTTKYVPFKDYGIYAVKISTGEDVWHRKHYASWASPALHDGKLFIGGSAADTTFYCYDARTGELLWKNEEPEGAIDTSPVVANGVVYFGTNEVNGTIYALNASNGETLWKYKLHIPPGFGGGYNVASHPAIADATLFIGADNVGVLAFRDRILWEGSVFLTENETFSLTAHNSGKSYEVNLTTALGALDAASKGRFSYTVSDEWFETYGSLFVDSIAGIQNAGMEGWMYLVNGEMPSVGVNKYEVKDNDTVTFYYGSWTTTPENASAVLNIHVHIFPQPPPYFDTEMPSNPYPSIAGVHEGTITLTHDVVATKLLVYPCVGTGGHAEFARFWNETWSVNGTWNGYEGGWSVLFEEPVVLKAGETYHYEIQTGSYPQIFHTENLKTQDGEITCTKFIDVNGREYNDWIPAFRLF